MSKHAVIFLAWGETYVGLVKKCIKKSAPIQSYDKILITDNETNVEDEALFTKIIRADFQFEGLLRKTELIRFLPDDYELCLLLDSDVIILEDISFGFEKAEQYSIALAPSPHYSLDYFWDFGTVMDKEGMPGKAQMQYNSGVIFFRNSQAARDVLERWYTLAAKHLYNNDQPLLTMAMEQLQFNPYTLSPSYNHRSFGENISGKIYVWHSTSPVPPKLNDFKESWPLRKSEGGKMIYPGDETNVRKILAKRFKKFVFKLIPRKWRQYYHKFRRRKDYQ